MTFSKHHFKISAAGLAGLGLAVLALSVVYSREPRGYFGSYKMLPHDSGDVLHFTNGVVSWESCCGQEFLGTYTRSPEGAWLWHYSKKGGKKVYTNEFILRPSLLWLACTETKAPTNTWRFPRRLIPPSAID